MQATWSKSLLIVGIFLASSAHAYAQPLIPHADSIETTVANADLVFIATIEKFDPKKPTDDRPGHDATIIIEETLKIYYLQEESYKRMSIFIPHAASVLEDWQKRGARLLIIAYDEYYPYETKVIELTPGKMEIMTADFKLLRNPEPVLKAARETIRRMPTAIKRINTVRLSVPHKIIIGTQWQKYYGTGGHLMLTVPADERLEKRAQAYIRSESYMKRYEGIQALRYFKSDKNITLVKTLLKDPGITRNYSPGVKEEPGTETTIYAVRSIAHQVLRSWGVEVEKPVIRVEVRK
ncbi:MAG: hypothetical protein COA78_18730 [Blastopirellula sp.]|nr:MAG: hypothetical protein COA78_18730 [Blastopirellula sp.]